ncbi:glutamate synthase-related protein [Anaerostipes sp.]|uniref:glutamate synthase-related protein n=1 Tax=Anaerostipes sp. TaxID=1872530 RepID=UPI0025BBEA4A|nr:glutamate synthase-related protein [Anaerostipes sp.]MBS7009492.1 rubredoxin [Anaerostipes sp.]
MSIFKCSICGYVYDDEAEAAPFSQLGSDFTCPVCKASKDKFEPAEDEPVSSAGNSNPLAYPEAFSKSSSKEFPQMDAIHQMALTGSSVVDAMGTLKPIISWDDILIMGAQLNPAPLNAGDPVNTKTVIGKKAKKPMEIYHPVYVSHMSFGALSKELKTALAKGSAMSKTAMCSGEGGILPEERQAAYKYIFEYVPNLYSVTDENLRNADAIEIKIGQGTKPGMGGHLPGDKVTPEIAKIRNKPLGEDVISPSKFPNINSKEDLKTMVDWLKDVSGGRPVGVKIAAGHIEQDLEWIAYADADFVTIDGRGGATGASPRTLKDNTSIPTIFALSRARKYLDRHHLSMDLVITGGLRLPGDFAKALAMGADAIAVASAALVAAACQQYRICNTGQCPVGVATQDEELRKRLHIENSAKRLCNYLNVCRSELEMFGRITGHADIHDLSVSDLRTTNREISEYTDIEHV